MRNTKFKEELDMIIKLRWLKQKAAGLVLLLLGLIFSAIFGFEGSVGFSIFVMGVAGIVLLLSTKRLFYHDYILYFDVDKFRGLR